LLKARQCNQSGLQGRRCCRASCKGNTVSDDHDRSHHQDDHAPVRLHKGGQQEQSGVQESSRPDAFRHNAGRSEDDNENNSDHDRLLQVVQQDEGGVPDEQFIKSDKDSGCPGTEAGSHSSRSAFGSVEC